MSKITVPGTVHGVPQIELNGRPWTQEALILAYLSHELASSLGDSSLEIDAAKLMEFSSRVQGMIVETPDESGLLRIMVQAKPAPRPHDRRRSVTTK